MTAPQRKQDRDDRVLDAIARCAAMVSEQAGDDPFAAAVAQGVSTEPMQVLYAFVRFTKDLARRDDPLPPLQAWEADLVTAFHGEADHPILVAVAETARSHELPIGPLLDMVAAERAALSASVPPTFASYVEGCTRDSGPLARMILHLLGERSHDALLCGERFATGLRMLDDALDLRSDAVDGRVRLPEEDWMMFGIDPEDMAAARWRPGIQDLSAFAAARAQTYLLYGRPLARSANGPVRELVRALLRPATEAARILIEAPRES